MTQYTVKGQYVEVTGEVIKARYGNGSLALLIQGAEPDERLTVSVNLVESEGLVPPPDCIFVKAYSGHEGIPEALADAGIAEYVDGPSVGVGPHDASVVLMRVLV